MCVTVKLKVSCLPIDRGICTVVRSTIGRIEASNLFNNYHEKTTIYVRRESRYSEHVTFTGCKYSYVE